MVCGDVILDVFNATYQNIKNMSNRTKLVDSKVHGVSNELKTKVKQTITNLIEKIKDKHL